MKTIKAIQLALATTTLCSNTIWATNGMNLEGYGTKATAMGGASMAYDSGNSAVMNNPATLGLMSEGKSRVGLGLRMLGPDVVSSSAGEQAESGGTAYYMPSISYMHREGNFTYGAAILAQGGMGTEYSTNSFVAQDSGDKVRSEVGVGRVMLPLVYTANDRLTVGGSLDLIWASMDLKMAVRGGELVSMVQPTSSAAWLTARDSLSGMDWGRFDYSDNSDYTGEATGYGFAGKLGFTYRITDTLTIGATYHTETNISDLETDEATLSAGMANTPAAQTFNGTIKVRDFQWPSTYGIGLAYQPNGKWMIAADYRCINWSDAMDSFKMSFIHPAFGELDVVMPQKWENQRIFSIGGEYRANNALSLRAGINYASNPVPNSYVNPLFPAIIESHLNAGLGYKIAKDKNLSFALTYAPEVRVTNAHGTEITHSQLNWSMGYSQSF